VKGDHSWNQVYFALYPGRLNIYKSKEDFKMGKIPSRIFILTETLLIYSPEEEYDEENVYSVDLSGHSMLFASENPDDKYEWMLSLRNECSVTSRERDLGKTPEK
jgi:hypothetical protein